MFLVDMDVIAFVDVNVSCMIVQPCCGFEDT